MAQEKTDEHSQYREKNAVSGQSPEPQPGQQSDRCHKQQFDNAFAFSKGHCRPGRFRFSFPIQKIGGDSVDKRLKGNPCQIFQKASHITSPASP